MLDPCGYGYNRQKRVSFLSFLENRMSLVNWLPLLRVERRKPAIKSSYHLLICGETKRLEIMPFHGFGGAGKYMFAHIFKGGGGLGKNFKKILLILLMS